MFNYRHRLQGLREWYYRFKGRKFYSRVKEVYHRSIEKTQDRIKESRNG